MRARRSTQHAGTGMTVLELMIVLAIIGMASILVRSGFRMITKADLVEDSTELSAIMRRASSLAIEHGEMHRVVFDLEKSIYVVEVCQGATAIQRNEKLRVDNEAKKRALDKGKERLQGLPPDALSVGDPEEATRRATAISGHHIADRTCVPATDTIVPPSALAMVGSAAGPGAGDWVRKLRVGKGIRFKQILVQHQTDPVTSKSKPPQVAIYFFPTGASEKAVIELTDGEKDDDGETFSVLVYGLTGRVELRDGALRDVNDHMLRNAMGDKDAKREDTVPPP